MYEEHISDEDIKKFVSYHGTLKGEEGNAFIELSKNVNGHIRGCQECLDKVREAQREQDKIDGIKNEYITDRSKHMRTVDEISDEIAEGFGISKEAAREQRKIYEELIEKMHDKGQPYIGHEDPKALEEIAKKSKSGIQVEPRATEIMRKSTEGSNKTEAEKAAEMTEEYLKGKTDKGIGDLPKQIATADKEAILKESELMPLKKKGFKEWIKGLVDKLIGKGEK